MTWFKVACLEDIPPGSRKMVIADDQLIALFNVDGTIYAVDDLCPHQGAPLSEGLFIGCVAVCPWHGAEFDVTNGKLLSGPGVRDVRAYPVSIKGDDVEIELS
jgi:nitrite reductase/ring-hydroxylating ferredoxin subunit